MDASLKTIYAVDEEQSLLEPIHTLCHHPNSIFLQLATHLQHAKRSSRNRVKLFQNKDNQNKDNQDSRVKLFKQQVLCIVENLWLLCILHFPVL